MPEYRCLLHDNAVWPIIIACLKDILSLGTTTLAERLAWGSRFLRGVSSVPRFVEILVAVVEVEDEQAENEQAELTGSAYFAIEDSGRETVVRVAARGDGSTMSVDEWGLPHPPYATSDSDGHIPTSDWSSVSGMEEEYAEPSWFKGCVRDFVRRCALCQWPCFPSAMAIRRCWRSTCIIPDRPDRVAPWKEGLTLLAFFVMGFLVLLMLYHASKL
jgi:hypothetical protein